MRNAEFGMWNKGPTKFGMPKKKIVFHSAFPIPHFYYTPFAPSVKDCREKTSLWPGNT